MVRKLLSGRVGLAAVAALGLSGFVTNANAATINFDLRAVQAGSTGVVGTSKSATVAQSGGQSVKMELYAQITNLDDNHANDAFSLLHTSLISVENAATGARGNLSVFTPNSAVLDTGVSNGGTVADLDANPADLELGSNAPTAQAGYAIASSGTNPKFGTGAGAGVTEFLLGSIVWTYGNAGTTPTLVNFNLRVKIDGSTLSRQTVKYTTDGIVKAVPGDNSDGAGEINLGDAVSIAVVPEPASLGLLGLAGLGALRRRRSM